MKKQIIVIHGGDTFDSYDEYFAFLKNWQLDFERLRLNKKDWKASLSEKLGPEFEVIAPGMPDKQNAKYSEWKIWFEKIIPYLEPEVILIGHSLGATFLVKYLSENEFLRSIRGAFLVAPPFSAESGSASGGDAKNSHESLADFELPDNLDGFEKQSGKIFLYHSKDDEVVPFADFEKYREVLLTATSRAFDDRGHFNQEEFPEIVSDIKSL